MKQNGHEDIQCVLLIFDSKMNEVIQQPKSYVNVAKLAFLRREETTF
jgi:hypothetical protein